MTLTLFNLYHFVTFFFVGYTQGRKNLALRKPAYQSSTTEYSFGGRTHLGVADYAVDGNLEVEEIGSTCIRAGWDLNPWWAVDLQDIYRIDEVAIVTRNWGFIMTNFSVELSAFTDGTPNGFINPVTCFYESGWVPQGVTRVYPCSTSTMARFVKVTRWDWAADRVMAFCQVMVYGSDTERDFSVKRVSPAVSQREVLEVVRTPSLLACVVYCRLSPICTSFYFDKYHGCELLVEGRGTAAINISEGTRYKFDV